MAELNSYRPGSTIQSNPTAGLRSDRYDRMLEERDALKTELSLPSPIQVSAEEYSFLSRSLAGLEGKQRDEMKYRLGSAMAFSRNLGISVEQAYASLPALAKAQLDIEYKPDATTFRSLQDSLAIGVLNSQLNDTANQYMDAYLAGEDVSALDARIKALDSEIQRRQDSAPRWVTTKMLQMSLQNIPFMADVFMEGAESYMRTASIGQGMALAAGLVGGPATLATAEVGTQIASIATAISTIARVWTTKEWTSGEQFYELVNQGADPTAAATMSELSGWMQGLIEESGGPLTSLNKALGMANKTPREFTSKVSAYLFLKGKTGRFIRDIGRFGVDVAAEGFEEVQQQFVDDVTDAITYTLSDMEIPEGNWTTPEEYAEAFAGGVGVAAILGVAPSIITSRIEGRQAQTINALAQSGLSEGQFTAAAKSVLPEDITEHASEEDINSLLHTVYENNADRRAKSVLNREGIRTRVQETDKNPQDVNQETAEPTPTIDDEPVRLPSGIYRINGMDEREAEHVPSGGTRLKATVTDPSGKLVYADITYIRKGNNIDIQGIDITEGEHLQTEGFRDDILRQFASMYPDYNVTFSNPRFSAESDSVSRVIASNPRGQQYGLNFGLDFSEEDRAGVAERIRLFDFGEEQKSAAVRLIQMLGAAEGKTGVEFFDSRFQGTITEEDFARLFPEEYARAQSGGGMNAAYIPSSRVPESLRSASDMGNSVRGILVAGRNANPTSFEHEVIHALMQDREKQDSFSDIFAKEMDGQEAFWDFVHKSDLYKDSGVRENFDYIEAHPELFQKGAQWGARQHEFVARLEEMYRLSGQSTRPELRSFFQRLTDFFRRIYRAMKQEGALSDEIVAYFDSFFGTPEDLQARQQSADGSASQASMDEILRQGPISAAEFDEFRRRLLSDPSNFDADGNPLAPNGKRSNLTLEQWITVRTPEFKAWFGDWELDPENASKVVDENGEPLVVYHGTNNRERKRVGRYPDGTWKYDYSEFSVFRGTNFFNSDEDNAGGYGSTVYPVFLNLRNPLIIDADGQNYSYIRFNNEVHDTYEIAEYAKSNGYDGVIFNGLYDGVDYAALQEKTNDYVTFNPNQIKSATRNSGAFSSSPDIYYQTATGEWQETEVRLRANAANFDEAGRPLAPNGQLSRLPYREWVTVRTPSFINWFGDWMNDPENASKVVDENGEPKIVYHGTMYDFSVFEAGQGAYYGAGLYFAGHREFAENWTHGMGRVVAAFLNLRNPNYVGTRADMDWSENNPDKIEAFAAGIRDYLNENHRPGDAEDAYNILSRMRVANVNTLLSKAQQLAHGPLFARSIESINRIFAETTGIDGFLVDYKDWQMALVSNQIKSVENIGTFDSSNPDIYYQLSPEYVRENMDYETKMPTDEAFLDAVRNTPSASIVDDGIIVDIERWQKPEQDSEASVRTGVFYLPRGASQSRYYRGGKGFYGGAVHFTGETLLKAPLAVKGATGGNVPLKAYEALFGKEAAKKLEEDCESIMKPYQRSAKVNRAMDVYYEYLPYADDDYMDFSTLEINSREGNQLRYAVQENIIAHAVREAGYDSVVGYNRGNLTEIFDVREGNYPSELSSDPWATYIPNDPEKILFQTPSEQQAEAKAKLEKLLTMSDDEVLREIGNGREFVFNTDIEEALTDIRSIMNVSEDYDEFIGFMEAVRDNSSLDAAARRRLRKALRKRLAGERAEVTVPPEVILNDSGDYIDTYQMLKAEQEDSEGESLAAPVSNDIPGVLGADERDKAITGDGDESGEVEDAALRRAMETGEETRENGEAERVIRESDETIKRIDAEQAELESQLAEAEDELSAEDRRTARQEAIIESLQRESDAKDAVRGFPEGRGDSPARIINRREYRRMWREFLAQKDRDYIKFWTDYVKTLEKEERDAIKAGRKRSEEEYVQWWDNIIRHEDEKYYRNAAREAKRIRNDYISWWKKKLDAEAARADKKAAVARTTAKYRAIIQRMEENQRAKDKARKERQQALRVQRYKETLVSRIMRRISANTAIEQADMIRAIQALMTEDDRQTVIIRGERWSVELLKEMFRDTPNDPMFSALSPQNLEILTKKRPSDFTVSELENLLDAVNQLRREGLRAWQAVVDARAAEDRAIIRAMVDTVSKNKHYTNPPAPGSDDEAAADTGFRRRFWDAVYNVINLPRIAQLLDNGAPDGPFQRMLVRRNREYENAQARAISQRISVLTKALQELGIKPSDLFKSYDVVIDADAGLHGPYSLSQLVYVHYAMNNAKNYQALVYGTLVTPEEKDAIQEQVREDIPGDPDEKLKTNQLVQGRHTREEEWRAEANERVRRLGDRRYEEFRRQADAILAENPKVMSAAEAVLGDMNGDGFERVQRIMLEQFNRRISKEDFYMPIRRMDWTEVKYDKANAESVRASQLAEEALRGVPRFRPGSVERGFTEERQEISPLNQKPINFDFFQIWQDSVRDEEHLVASMAYVRSLKRVFGDPILQRAITRTHGKEAMGLINEFIQNTAEPWNHIKRDGISNAVRFFRGGLYTSYLGFRASNIIMQAVTSPMPFLSAGVTPAAYMRQLFRFMSDYDQTWQMITELSPMMAERSFDELPALLSEERRAIREQRGSEAEQRIRQSLDKLQEISLWGLDRVDRVAVGAGWLAIYEREMQRNGGISSEAVRAADDAVLATQPVQRKSEMSRLFRSDNEFARLLTQFTSSLNVVFQNIFFDIPMAYRNRQWGKFWGTIAAYALSGALLFLIREEPWKDSDDDGEKEFQWRQLIYSFFSQAVDSVPLISDSVSQMVYEPITGESAFTFFGSEFPPLERLARVPGNITEGEWQKALRNSLESIGLFSGIPVLAAEDYWDALVSITQGEAPESIWR